MSERPQERRARAAVWLALAALCAIVFAQTLRHGFINFDDNGYVTENPFVRAGLSWAAVRWAFTSIDYFYWQPLTWLSHMLDCTLFGLNAGWHHLVSLLLHIGNSILVFAIFRRMTGAFWRSAVVAALFAVHPLRIESVAWIAERKDLLSCLCFLLATWAYLRFVERPSDFRYLLVLFALALGLMAKPMLVAVPFLLLLLDYWPLRRVAFAEKLPMLVLAAVSSFITYLGTSHLGVVNFGASLPFSLRLENSLLSYVRYVGLTLWPRGLAILYPYPHSIPIRRAAAAALLLAAITLAALWFGRRHRYLTMGWLWFVVGIGPAIGLVQVGHQAMADRFTYIPLIGLFAAIVWATADLLADRPKTAAALAALAVASYAALSWSHTRVWRDSVSVFADAIDVTSKNAVAEHYLAAALDDTGRFEEALPHHAAAVRIEPNYFVAQCAYGIALERRGDPAAAAAHFREALRRFPRYADAHYHLGTSLSRLGRTQEASAELTAALDIGLSNEAATAARRLLAP
jgi:tetratricopeptide (TPR) repeat protein